MTVEQEIAQKATEVEERKKARKARIRLETIKTLALGILDLLDMVTTSTGEEIPIERVNVHYDELGQTWVNVTNKVDTFSALEDDEEVACKIRNLNGISVNEAEDRYLQSLLGKHRKVGELQRTAFTEFTSAKGFSVE